MCGIAGLVGKEERLSGAALEAMLDCIRYRGPDDEGQWSEDRVMLGHRRLSILDLSAGGKQPMPYADRYVLVFNGEIYNYLELKEELRGKGYRFRTETDSEVIPAAYDCWGDACQEHMNGMWAFALYDRLGKTLFCSRDRFGIKPFYYMERDGLFAFGSEIKQLLAILPEPPHVNGPVLEAFLAAGYLDCSEETMFREVRQLRGGQCLRYDVQESRLQIRRWFSPEDISVENRSESEIRERFHDGFVSAVERHLRSDVEVGSCLSGGLDSSAIVCAVNRMTGGKPRQHAITACFEQRGFDERPFSHAVAERCDNLSVSEVFPDMEKLLEELDDMIWHMDEPFASTSVFAQRAVFRRAGELGLKVMLDGQGSDEMLAGYPDFYKLMFSRLFRSGRWRALRREARAYRRLHPGQTGRSRLRFFAVTALETLTPLWLQQAVFRRYQSSSSDRRWLCLTREGKDRLCAIKRRFAKRDPQAYICASLENGLSELLHYEDRNSMAFSVEARVPFLDADFAACAISVPFSMKLRDGKTKWILRESLGDILPEIIARRTDKMGFVTPEAPWLREHLSELEPLLREAAARLSPWIDGERFLHWAAEQGAERDNYRQIWRVLCASEWIKVFRVRTD